ncbi:MAG TPA: tRNA (guanosine(37)-N1)-methyltransferase TrmD [Acidimicrobiales bacterium]|nr:tRNA (guanosine(37)-N1)-methyltransferase TrmD [Acidimicrobiales bacterium]
MTFAVDVITLFPGAVEDYCATSVLGRAREAGVWRLRTLDPREETDDVHRSVDDAPLGGGAGMVMRAEPIVRTVRATPDLARPVIALTPAGRPFDQDRARALAATSGLTLVCGRYEGIDQRAIDLVCDEELSVGDVVLAGGELAALVVIEAVVRLLPGALGNEASIEEESFAEGLIEYPHYTRPAVFEGRAAPAVLLSGDHGRIARWRRAQSLVRTLERRPDLLERRGGLTAEERALIEEFTSPPGP